MPKRPAVFAVLATMFATTAAWVPSAAQQPPREPHEYGDAEIPGAEVVEPVLEAAAPSETTGYRIVYDDGAVDTFGLSFDPPAPAGDEPLIDATSTLTGAGVMTLAGDGGVFAYGDTRFAGSPAALPLNSPVVGIDQLPTGRGYRIAAADGGIFAYGEARFSGSMGGRPLNQPIVGMASTPSGFGYWLVASDGGIFAFGDATFFGSMGGRPLNRPIVGMASTSTGDGYWLIADDGGVFSFGDARFAGSPVGRTNAAVVDIAATKQGLGYWVLAADGAVYAYGDAPFLGRGTTAGGRTAVAIDAPGLRYVDVQMLAFNDFHGNLEPPSGRINNTDVGGAAFLAAHLNSLRAGRTNSITVSNGDLIGASPLVSAVFSDEPTIEVMNAMRLDVNALGNHEFDDGVTELRRMLDGGCVVGNASTCAGGRFAGADFPMLSANVIDRTTGRPLLDPYVIREFQGARIGIIGLPLSDTPSIVTPSGVAGVEFQPEVAAINRSVVELRAQGVETIVVLLHHGATPASTSPFNGCDGVAGPAVDIANAIDPAVEVVATAHFHQIFNCSFPISSGGTRLVTQASAFGRALTEFSLVVDRTTGRLESKAALNRLVTRDVTPDPAVSAIVSRYQALSAPLQSRVVGRLTGAASNTANAAGETPAGLLIADSQLAATAAQGAQIAFMNPGGVRAALPPTGDPNAITYGNIFTVQPFGNSLVTLTLTGAQIEQLLEQQFPPTQTSNRILQPSNGFTYTYVAAGPAGDKVDPATIQLNGATVNPAASYRVTVNSFLADGGDRFSVLNGGTNRVGGAQDLDAVEQYLAPSIAGAPITPPTGGRISAS
jgi:5'-nucleotidase